MLMVLRYDLSLQKVDIRNHLPNLYQINKFQMKACLIQWTFSEYLLYVTCCVWHCTVDAKKVSRLWSPRLQMFPVCWVRQDDGCRLSENVRDARCCPHPDAQKVQGLRKCLPEKAVIKSSSKEWEGSWMKNAERSFQAGSNRQTHECLENGS